MVRCLDGWMVGWSEDWRVGEAVQTLLPARPAIGKTNTVKSIYNTERKIYILFILL